MKTWLSSLFALALLSAGAALRAEEGTAIFAAGCFWCVEEAFDGVPGVLETTSGYTGGRVVNPTYRQVTRGDTGHVEALEVRFDPGEVSYAELLEVFWRNVDPFDEGGQFCDRGSSYLSAIFVKDEAQRAAAEASRARLASDPGAGNAGDADPRGGPLLCSGGLPPGLSPEKSLALQVLQKRLRPAGPATGAVGRALGAFSWAFAAPGGLSAPRPRGRLKAVFG